MAAQGTKPALTGSFETSVGGDEIAARAIGFAQKYGTPLSPAVYEVWYTYAGRTNPHINEALDLAMNMDQPIGSGDLQTLYHQFLAATSHDDRIASIGNDLTATIGNVTAAMDENLREHSIFSGSLRSARASLVQGTSKREVTDVIRDLHKANQQHLQAAQRLNVQLEKSRAQVAKLKSELIEAKRTSNTDYLTGLPNRRMLDEHLDNAIFLARQKKQPLTLLMGAIDGLDRVARGWGVTASDAVIQRFAETLSQGLRPTQIAARFAGSKFAIALPAADLQDGFAMAEAVRKRFKTNEWVSKETGDNIGVLSVSFGGAGLRDGEGRDGLLERSDRNLILAQSEGSDRTLIR